MFLFRSAGHVLGFRLFQVNQATKDLFGFSPPPSKEWQTTKSINGSPQNSQFKHHHAHARESSHAACDKMIQQTGKKRNDDKYWRCA
jgi:hypothetical protein